MANESKTQLKSYFQLGDKPNQAQFENLIDSMVDADQAGYPIFSTSKSYVVDDVVAYGGKFYRFISIHAAGSWVGTDAEETSIKAETNVKLTELESDTNTKLTKLELRNVDNSIGVNLVNPSKITKDVGFLGASGNISSAPGYCITDYIPVNGQNISAETYMSEALEWNSAVVYDSQLNPIRRVQKSKLYEYQEGDVYVRFMLQPYGHTPNLRANYGNTLLPYEKYNPIEGYVKEGFQEINTKISELETTDKKTDIEVDNLELNTFSSIKFEDLSKGEEVLNIAILQNKEYILTIFSDRASFFRVSFQKDEEQVHYIESIYVQDYSSNSVSLNTSVFSKPCNKIVITNVNNAKFVIELQQNFGLKSDISKDIKSIEEKLEPNLSALAEEVLPNAYISETGSVVQTGVEGKVVKLPIIGGLKYRIQATFGISSQSGREFRIYGFYNSSNINSASFISGGELYTSPYDLEDEYIEVEAPLDATYIAIHYKSTSLNVTELLNKELISKIPLLQEKTATLKDYTEIIYNKRYVSSSFWTINGIAANAARITNEGEIIPNTAGYSQGAGLCFLNPQAKSVYIKTKAYAGSNVDGCFYAFYSTDDYTKIGTSTCLSVGPKTGTYSTAEFEGEVAIPEGAKTLVVIYYQSSLDVTQDIAINNKVAKNEDRVNNITQKDVFSGTPTIYSSMEDMSGSVGATSSIRNYIENSWLIIDNRTTGHNAWAYSKPFNPDGAHLIHVTFRAELYEDSAPFYIYIAKGTGAGQGYYGSVATISKSGEYDVTIDASYYRVYQGFTDTFYIWIFQDKVVNFKIYDFKIFQLLDELPMSNIEGTNSRDMFKSVDTSLSNITKIVEAPSYIIAPNGNKYLLGVDNEGNLITKPLIPNKIAYFGNSLIFGNSLSGVSTFGMCASQADKDFYTKTNNVLRQMNPSVVTHRYSIVPFETISSTDDINSVVASTIANLQGDEDLIIIQGGDNVNATNAKNILPTSSKALLSAIRTKCTRARVFWAAIWYSSAEKMAAIQNACKQYGCSVIPIASLYSSRNWAEIGSLIDFGAEGTEIWTLDDVSNLVENSANNITVTFTYNNEVHTTTLDVSSYSLSGSTLSYSGRYRIVTLQFSHPGDRGMTAIANMILYSIGVVDTEEYYPVA